MGDSVHDGLASTDGALAAPVGALPTLSPSPLSAPAAPTLEVPTSLAERDLFRISESLLAATGAALLTAMTGLGGFITLAIAGSKFLSLGGPESSPVVEILLLFFMMTGVGILMAGLGVGVFNYVLPRTSKFVLLVVRAPWFLPATALIAPFAALWRAGWWWSRPWERALDAHDLQRQWALRARRYGGHVDGRSVRVHQDLLGNALVIECAVRDDLPAAYVGRRRVAGHVGVLRPALACLELTEAELLLRDGVLAIRRPHMRPNLKLIADVAQQVENEFVARDARSELRALTLLDRWRLVRSAHDDGPRSPWFAAPALAAYLDTLERRLRTRPPNPAMLEAVLRDTAIASSAKAWVLATSLDRMEAEQVHALLRNVDEKDPTTLLAHAPRWPAWIGVRLLTLEGGADALNALQRLVTSDRIPAPLRRAARQATLRIIQRSGGVHTLTGHLSVVEAERGRLGLTDEQRRGALAEFDSRTAPER